MLLPYVLVDLENEMPLLFSFFQQIHQRVPLYIGSVEEVEKLEKYLA